MEDVDKGEDGRRDEKCEDRGDGIDEEVTMVIQSNPRQQMEEKLGRGTQSNRSGSGKGGRLLLLENI